MGGADDALPLRLYALDDLVSDRRGFNGALIDFHDVLCYRLRIHEGFAVDHGHAVGHALIHVGDVGDVVDRHVVVDIRDLNVGDVGVGDVNILHVTRTAAIPGNKNFSWRERKPSHADADSDAEAAASNKSDQGRRVHGSDGNRSRNPAPAAAHECPAAIVEGSKAP